LGLDTAQSRRPSIKYDSTRKQYFVPSPIFTNLPAFINSFYTNTVPPYDPTVSQMPQEPTHFVVRDISTGIMITPAKIPVAQYAQAFSAINDVVGMYVGMSVMVEFLNVVNSNQTNVLFACPVDVTSGTYIG
jgi:hypothetical protein